VGPLAPQKSQSFNPIGNHQQLDGIIGVLKCFPGQTDCPQDCLRPKELVSWFSLIHRDVVAECRSDRSEEVETGPSDIAETDRDWIQLKGQWYAQTGPKNFRSR
jgi:hypothetical protein